MHLLESPDAPITVSVTVFLPMFSQVNAQGLTFMERIPQVLVEPLFI
jgi:hypothetical protein